MMKDNNINHIFPFATLLILDGWGISNNAKYNAIKMAHTPNLDKIYKNSYNTMLNASGLDVGLPESTVGNSEVGHMNIGAGRVVLQDVLRIDEDINDNGFFKNPVLLNTMHSALNQDKSLHLIGLISDALVHSNINHLFALLKMAKEIGLKKVYIHAITDGRDVSIDSSYKYINLINECIQKLEIGKFSTVGGRYFAMDRDSRWDRIKKYYDCLTNFDIKYEVYKDPITGINESFKKNITDEFIDPFRIEENGKINLVEENDSVIFFNFREDRARQLTYSFIKKDFSDFERKYINTFFTTFTEYEKDLCKNIVYPKFLIQDTLSEVVSNNRFSQFKIAETEKYAHITYFFNGGREVEFPLEDRVLIPSDKVPTYDTAPKMKVFEITDELISRIKSKKYKLLVANFANADMVGHTGNLDATVKACEYIDECIGKIYDETILNNGVLVITGDHGNAEDKYDEIKKQKLTSHTTNPVPFILTTKNTLGSIPLDKGSLCDISPTLLPLLGFHKPSSMNGIDLLI